MEANHIEANQIIIGVIGTWKEVKLTWIKSHQR